MNRVMKSILWVVACAIVMACVFAFSDYYDAIFKARSLAQRTVESDTWQRMERRAMWGGGIGTAVGMYMALRAWRKGGNQRNEPWDD